VAAVLARSVSGWRPWFDGRKHLVLVVEPVAFQSRRRKERREAHPGHRATGSVIAIE
jgi:hypothetical protein